MSTIDIIVIFAYFLIVSAYGYWIYRSRQQANASAKGFFLAEGSLTWWAIGASIIASNISAEQIVAMSGSGFHLGLAVAGYEWLAAVTILFVAIFLLPSYLKNKIYTMPQFLNLRFDHRVGNVLTFLWLLIYIFVNLTSIIYLGAFTLEEISGLSYSACGLMLTFFALIITIGGMRVIGYTDVIQVLVLVIGCLITVILALQRISGVDSLAGALTGFQQLIEAAPSHFHMYLKPDHVGYKELPGFSAVFGAMWICHLNYWGCNQYITQRALGANLTTGRQGLLFAAFIKLFMPIIVVIPGIAVYHLYLKGQFIDIINIDGKPVSDKAYSALLTMMPTGIRGLAFAALTAAIVASLAGKANSIASIFTLDIYKKIAPTATETKLVWMGRCIIIISLIISFFMSPLVGFFEGGFSFIQEFTGFISPAVCIIFLFGMFWKKASSTAAFWVALAALPFSSILKWAPQTFGLTPGLSIPFLDRMGYATLFLTALMLGLSYLCPDRKTTAFQFVSSHEYKLTPSYLSLSALICTTIFIIYYIFW